MLEKIELIVLVCDRSKYINDFWSQFGLSILINCYWEGGISRRILFDTGWESDPLLHNMKKLDIDVGSIDTLVLSHCHYDHTGGLEKLVSDEGSKFKLIGHKDIARPVYSLKPEIHYIGIDDKLLETLPSERLMLLEDATEIYPGVKITGSIPRVTSFEKPEEDVYILHEGKLIEDLDKDDMALVFEIGQDGIVIVTGCSHAGVINTIKQAINISNKSKILGIIGGFHLIDKTKEAVDMTIDEMKKLNIKHIYSGHCTGFEGEALLNNKFGEKHSMFYTGDKVTFMK